MEQILEFLRKDLITSSNPATKESSKRFFKEEVKTHGVKTKLMADISRKYFKEIKGLPKAKIFYLCEELWKSGYMEEGFIACNWSYAIRKGFEPTDFAVLDRWVNSYISNWATCDTLCNHTVGAFVQMYPNFIEELKGWAVSPNRWVRRAAAVSLIVPARRGEFLSEVFDIADLLLLDRDDMVQKGYGWLLKVTSQAYQQQVFNYVIKHKATMPRTALRYAIEKMPPDLRKKAMERG